MTQSLSTFLCHFINFQLSTHGGCDQSTEDAYFSMTPDPISGFQEVRVYPMFTRIVDVS